MYQPVVPSGGKFDMKDTVCCRFVALQGRAFYLIGAADSNDYPQIPDTTILCAGYSVERTEQGVTSHKMIVCFEELLPDVGFKVTIHNKQLIFFPDRTFQACSLEACCERYGFAVERTVVARTSTVHVVPTNHRKAGTAARKRGPKHFTTTTGGIVTIY